MPKILTPDDLDAFRDRLCDVAERQFAEHGPDAVTIRQLATALGVSPMTPYRYFKDKDAILAAVRARAFDRHAQALEDAYDAAPGDARDRSRRVGEAYVRFALEHPEAYKLIFDIRQPDWERYPDLTRAAQRSRATMTRHVRDLIAEGWVAGDPERIGHLYWAALHGPLMLHFSGLLDAPHDFDALIEGLANALWKSVARPGRVPAGRRG